MCSGGGSRRLHQESDVTVVWEHFAVVAPGVVHSGAPREPDTERGVLVLFVFLPHRLPQGVHARTSLGPPPPLLWIYLPRNTKGPPGRTYHPHKWGVDPDPHFSPAPPGRRTQNGCFWCFELFFLQGNLKTEA